MKKPRIPTNEKNRLKELEAYQIIGGAEDDDYDFITSMAAQICGTKISLVSLVTDDKQWFLSHHGLDVRETPKEYSFCAHAINFPDKPFIVEDARKDARFSDNPLTTGYPHVIFYAGIPLVNQNGFPLGSLCVIDNSPKHLRDEQIELLKKLSKQTMSLLELRKSQKECEIINKEIKRKNILFTLTEEVNQIGTWELDITSGQTIWSKVVYQIHEVSLDFDHNKANGIEFYHPDFRNIITRALKNTIENEEPFDVECLLITAKGNHKWVRSTGRKVESKVVGSFQDITKIKESELKFKGIFNSTFSFIGFLNTEGILLEANDTAVNMAGIQHEDVIGKYFWDCYWWQISAQTQKELKVKFQNAVSGDEVSYEVSVWIANQTPITILFSLKPIFDDRGNVVYIISEGRPIQEIVDTRRKYKSVIEGTNVGTWEWNVQTGETVFNERWAEIVGYTLEELAPININTWSKLAHPDDLSESGIRLNECFENKSEYYEIEARMKHKDGHWIWVFDRGKVFEWTDDGKPLMMYGTHQDITERKQKEESLRISEEAFRGNFENAAIGMALLDENGKWLKVNAKGCEIVGYTEEELLKLTFNDITHPDDLDADLKLLQELVNGERSHYQMEKRYFHKEGHIVYILLAVSMVKDNEGNVLYFISQIVDITKSKQQSFELSYQQDLLSALFNLSPIGIALNDYDTGNFIDVNQKLLDPIGYTKEEFLELSYWDVTPSEYSAREVLAMKQMNENSIYEAFESEYIRKDGSRYPVKLRGVLVEDLHGKKLIWSFIQDISKEKEAERKLHEAINRLQAVLDASTQVSIIATDKDGTITLFNSGAEKMLGYKSEEMIGKQTPLVIHLQSEIEEASRELNKNYEEEITGFDVFVHEAKQGLPTTKEWTYVRKNGATFPVLLSVTTVKDENCINGFLGVAVDVSELKKVQNEIKSLLDITQDQNNRLKNFAHIVSHNLRSHSGGISGILEFIKIDFPEFDDNELFKMVYKASENLTNTIEDLTEVVKVNVAQNNLSIVHLYNVVLNNINSLSLQIKESGVSINNRLKRDLTIKGVPAYLESIVLNLITNAIKYRSNERKSFLNIYTKKTGGNLVLYFEDNGLGIDLKRHGDKLFGMYKTFHQHDDSRGVGLYITKNQVESIGGKIDVVSKVNVGTTFKIYFPL